MLEHIENYRPVDNQGVEKAKNKNTKSVLRLFGGYMAKNKKKHKDKLSYSMTEFDVLEWIRGLVHKGRLKTKNSVKTYYTITAKMINSVY